MDCRNSDENTTDRYIIYELFYLIFNFSNLFISANIIIYNKYNSYKSFLNFYQVSIYKKFTNVLLIFRRGVLDRVAFNHCEV